MFNFTPRISRAYEDISGALQEEYKPSSFRMMVVQHSADEEVNRDHCHLMLYGTVVKEEALKRKLNKHFKEPLKGNSDWSWKDTLPMSDNTAFWETGIPGSDPEDQIFKYIRYMIKGDKNNIKYVNNIPDALIDAAANSWCSPVKRTDRVTIVEKVKQLPYQQDVITGAAAEWHKYKNECEEKGISPTLDRVLEMVCNEMRRVSKGINPYMVKELAYAVLFDDLDYRDVVMRKISKDFI